MGRSRQSLRERAHPDTVLLGADRGAATRVSGIEIPQYRLLGVLGVWAAAAVPMAALAWILAPALGTRLSGAGNVPLVKALLISLAAGLVWQFVLVAVLLRREQPDLRWSTIRHALWLRSPRSPRSGRTGGRVWLVVAPLSLAFAATNLLLPSLPMPADRDLGAFMGSETGERFLSGAWGWFAVLVVLWLFNTVLGEELLFRGFLLPRMAGTFGDRAWLANGALFAVYHLHMPWAIPAAFLDALWLAYPTSRYRSAWIGIAVHSSQSLFAAALALPLVLS